MYIHPLLQVLAWSPIILRVFAFPAALPAGVSRSNGSKRQNLTTLHPGLHPDEDTSDLNNLKAHNDSSLYYQSSSTSTSSRKGAAVMQLTHIYPAVSLDRSKYLLSVTCNPASTAITVTFKDPISFRTAALDWRQHARMFLITYVPGCGSGVTSQERSFHLVSDFQVSEGRLQISAMIDTIPIHETIAEDQQTVFHVVTYSIRRPAPLPPHLAQSPSTAADKHNAELHNRGFFDSITDALAAVADSVLQVVNTVSDAVVAAVDTLTTVDANPMADFSFSTSNLVPFNANFLGQPAYELLHMDFQDPDSGVAETLDLFCVECGITAEVHFAGTLSGSLVDGFSAANVQVTADITATFILGVQATFTFSAPDNPLYTLEQPIPDAGLEIPGILNLGTFIVFSVDAGFDVSLMGSVSIGYVCEWDQVGAMLDLVDSSQSTSIGDWGLSGHCFAAFSLGVQFSATFTPGLSLSLSLELEVLPMVTSALSADISLVEETSLPFTATFATDGSNGCQANELGLNVMIESQLYISGTGFADFPLLDPLQFQLFNECADISLSARAASPANPGTTITWNNKPYRLDVAADGTVTVNKNSDSSTIWRSRGNLTFATSDGLGLYTLASTVEQGFGPLLVADELPDGSDQLILGRPANRHYLGAVDITSQAFYYLAFCTYVDDTMRIFLVADLDNGVNALLQDQTTAAQGVMECGAAVFTQKFD